MSQTPPASAGFFSSQGIRRRSDAPERLAAFIESRRHDPFAWGRNDCALFYADAVIAQYGVDVAKDLRGYKTEKGARARIKKAGGMRELARSCGLREKHAGFAQYGDGLLVVLEGRETFALCLRNSMWCAPGREALVFNPYRKADVAAAFELT